MKQPTKIPKIIPHLWFDKDAVAATRLYVSLFKDSRITSQTVLSGTPSGDCDVLSFTLAGQEFMDISAGPMFKLNPSISMFVVFNNGKEIEKMWNKLSVGGKVLMPFEKYPWAHKYGWVEDKYGLSWQLSWSDHHQFKQQITPKLMFTNKVAGKTKDAIEAYTAIFPGSKVEMISEYEEGEGDKVGYIKHSNFTLANMGFMAMDSSAPHKFDFNEALSFIVKCNTQDEIDYYWEQLSAVTESEMCGWCKDKYGVSWQIVPTAMDKMMESKDEKAVARVVAAFLKMKKFDIAILEKAFKGK